MSKSSNRFFAGALIDTQGRARCGEALTEGQLREVAPSIFAEGRHESRSDRFAYVPTWDVVQALIREGFQPVAAKQGRSRIEGKAAFTKHLIRFRHPTDKMRQVGDLVPETILMNAHDGTSSYRVMAGAFKGLCKNGLYASENVIGDVRIGHTGDIKSRVIEGTWSVVEDVQKIGYVAEDWQATQLSRDEQFAFAKAAHVLRFGDAEDDEEKSALAQAIPADQLLQPRRPEDRGNDLWRTFNVVQEHTVQGGDTGWRRLTPEEQRSARARSSLRRVTTRPVSAIDGDVRLNRALWVLAEKMAELKAV